VSSLSATIVETSPVPVVRALRVADACKVLGISKSALYREIAAHRLEARKAGSITLIPVASADAWLAGLPSKAEAAKAA
jgi:excisionase family DNA binding protein